VVTYPYPGDSKKGLGVEDGSADVTTGGEETAGELTRGQKMDRGLRWFGDFFFYPILWFFSKLHISPNMLTLFGVALAFASGYYLSVENVPVAAVFFVLSGVLDLVDGYVAKKMDMVSRFGSFLDSFSDRISDAAIFLGLAVYYMKRAEGLYVGLALAILVTSFLISYVRSRAEGLGISGKAGLMARAPRFLTIGFGLFFNGLSPWILRVVMWVVAALLLQTLVDRLLEVWRALEE
jgi:phosphatidylglycerophosphate synthase